MNFSSVRRSFFVAVPVRFGTKLFVLFFGWPPQATPGPTPLSPSHYPLLPCSNSSIPLFSNLPRTPHQMRFLFRVISFRFRFRFGFRFGLVWFGFGVGCALFTWII